jgi:sigma-B regulation protein RsbU (phosphoserine phosphatase)
MPSASPRKSFFLSLDLLRFQLVLLLIAACVRVLFWAFHSPSHIFSTLVYTLLAGNVSIVLILVGRPVFAGRTRPWNWVGYIFLLLCIGIIANIVAEIPVYSFFVSPDISFRSVVLADAPIGFVITFISGMLFFAFGETRSRLEASNRELQSQVQLGLAQTLAHQSDLQQAHEIQEHLLPRETPQLAGFQIACAWQPAGTVSGDYFDVLPVAPDQLGLCIADVSGKGMAAALLMSNLQASFRAFVRDNPSPAELCAKLNLVLCENIAPGRFVTLFYGILHAGTLKMRYENAGHCLPLLVHANGAIAFPAAYSGVLGLFSHWTYSDHDLELAPGDSLVLLTDGVLEAWNQDEEEFGYQRLITSVLAGRAQGAHGIRKRVLEDVSAFTSGVFQDDASLIVVTVD